MVFYVFPSIEKYKMKSVDFCKRLLNEYKLAVIPGVAFGEQGEYHIRISYAYSFKDLEEGLKRIKLFIEGIN